MPADEVVESIFWIVSEWASSDKEISGVFLDALVLSWKLAFMVVDL